MSGGGRKIHSLKFFFICELFLNPLCVKQKENSASFACNIINRRDFPFFLFSVTMKERMLGSDRDVPLYK